MARKSVAYDRVAATYDRRYSVSAWPGVSAALQRLAGEYPGGRLLEVGCGTGHWLEELAPRAARLNGLDLSLGMLLQARARTAAAGLVNARDAALPFPAASIDLAFCVNALHHFPRPADFIAEARRILRPGGTLAVIGMDPHLADTHSYIYDYFPGTRETDLRRYPAVSDLREWMRAAGFTAVESAPAQLIEDALKGEAILTDYWLEKDSTSQLILLSAAEYAAGIARIRAALAAAARRGETPTFAMRQTLMLTLGRVAG